MFEYIQPIVLWGRLLILVPHHIKQHHYKIMFYMRIHSTSSLSSCVEPIYLSHLANEVDVLDFFPPPLYWWKHSPNLVPFRVSNACFYFFGHSQMRSNFAHTLLPFTIANIIISSLLILGFMLQPPPKSGHVFLSVNLPSFFYFFVKKNVHIAWWLLDAACRRSQISLIFPTLDFWTPF